MVLPPEIVDLVASLRGEIEAFRGEVATLRAENAALRAENAELKRRLGLDSSTSSKPPSSDGLNRKSRVSSLRGLSDKPSGGQKGHKGGTLRQVENPDQVFEHVASACTNCCAALGARSVVGWEKRQVFDLPERLIEVSEHRVALHDCPNCRARTRATFPEGVVSAAQYGERLRMAAVYLNAQQLTPEERVAEILQDLFGAASACGASVAAWVRAKAQALEPVHRAIGEWVAEAKVRCLDETGVRIEGKTRWLHTASTLAYTYYRAGEGRSAVPTHFQGGVVVHDHFISYRALENVDHAYCNAHILRELAAVIELDGEPWAEALRQTLIDANDAVRQARQAGHTALDPVRIAVFEARYWAAVREGLAFHRQFPEPTRAEGTRGKVKKTPAHNLLIRLKTYKTETLRFMADFDVPFTNNLAERDLRMMKVKTKISGAFRTLQGAVDFARLRSVISTARKQGRNILNTLTMPSDLLRNSLAPT
jgi:transposase